MDAEVPPTKILIVDSDDASFEIRQCIAQTLKSLPPLELYHARDATEALSMLERLDPDVVVLDDSEQGECDLFIDSLHGTHPPIVFCTEIAQSSAAKSSSKGTEPAAQLHQEITYLQRSETLEGVHQTLVLAATIGMRSHTAKAGGTVH